MQHGHIYSTEWQLEETSSGQEARTPAGSRGTKAPLFPPSCWHWWCLFYQIQILHKRMKQPQKQTLTQLIFFIYSNSASAEIIFHRKTQDCQKPAGSYIKESKFALVLHRQLRLLLKAEANPTQVLLFRLNSRTDLPQNFTGLQLRNQAYSSSSFFFIPESQHTYPWYIKKEEMPKPDVWQGKMSSW